MWQRSHQPFHWFIEFHGIMKGGGFDVVIGNPPYVEYSKIKTSSYAIHPEHFLTEGCGNLLAYITERGITLLDSSGRIGLVLLVSTFSTERMSSLQTLTRSKCDYRWISNFAWRPSKLFDGCNTINAILIASKGSKNSPMTFSTKYLKWASEERDSLFATLFYGNASSFLIRGSIPKISSENDSIVVHKVLTCPRIFGPSIS